MRLNGWQRFGIVLSIAWALGAGSLTRDTDIERADHFVQYAFKVCADGKSLAHDKDLSRCEQERENNRRIQMEGSWSNVAFAALVPIPLGWLAVLVLIHVYRAQVIGFRAVVPWATLTLPKRALVVLSVLASLAVVLFGITAALNLYVDAQVPVGLAQRAMVIKTGDLVTAVGTWTRSGSTGGSSLAYPLQTSRIECNRQERRCMEARASVAGNLLLSEFFDYDMESWSNAAIVFRNDSFCASEVFTIDLNTEAVSGAGHSTNSNTELCKMFPGTEEQWKYQLSDGFKVYWEQRQKARPLPLRLIHTLFGN